MFPRIPSTPSTRRALVEAVSASKAEGRVPMHIADLGMGDDVAQSLPGLSGAQALAWSGRQDAHLLEWGYRTTDVQVVSVGLEFEYCGKFRRPGFAAVPSGWKKAVFKLAGRKPEFALEQLAQLKYELRHLPEQEEVWSFLRSHGWPA